ncbi:MAG TPA: oligopeptide:H+ symporter, partial [Thermoanaerobaculia bacterium]|nr:oligopeptide:H+ symporter [Thermoanaerobaculia bacterium]
MTEVQGQKQWFGHPRGLATLFMTEMWERASYYGMRALLTLYMVGSVMQPGLGFPVAKASHIYALYTMSVYLAGIPGGFLADRLIGHRRAVLFGGIIIALGHFSMVVPRLSFFYLGLFLIVCGTGLLKPNVSTIVGTLYTREDPRRDAGFSIFYMGINTGAFFAPIVTGWLGQKWNWHYGFAAAGVGMVFGIIQYVMG